MWLLSPFHPIRRIAIRVLAHPIFSLIVILTILANCYVMILPDSEYTNATEIVFTAIYTYESAVKVSKFIYRISLNNIRGNYLKVSKLYVLILTILWKKRGNYLRGDIIQGRILINEIQYSKKTTIFKITLVFGCDRLESLSNF